MKMHSKVAATVKQPVTPPVTPPVKLSQSDHRSDDEQIARLQTLLVLEAEMRAQRSVADLSIWAVNELRVILDYSQCVLCRLDRKNVPKVIAVSSLTNVDRHAPFIRWVEKRVDETLKSGVDNQGLSTQTSPISVLGDANGADVDDAGDNNDDHSGFDAKAVYPFSHVVCLPIVDFDGDMFGVFWFARQKNWTKNETIVMERLGKSFSHAFQTLVPKRKLRTWQFSRWLGVGCVALGALAMFIPVPMSALAPAEIVAGQPHIIAAPIDGVIKKIILDANVAVTTGDVLFTLEDTALRTDAEVALRKELVAQARYLTAKQSAFSDPKSNKQLASVRAEVALAKAERVFAQKRLDRTVVRANGSGLLIYSDKKDWIGKPVRVGERIMEIADTNKVHLKIDLPVSDAIRLKTGASVKFFLDAQPLSPIRANVLRASYRAKDVAGVGLAYQIVAKLDLEKAQVPRIGLRGTAQIFGDDVFLGYYLFRKPISAMRQYLGF